MTNSLSTQRFQGKWCKKSLTPKILLSIVQCWKFALPMLSTPCESVQICTDPDRYSRIFRKLASQKTALKLKLVE